jgi:chromosome segregation ATPase
VITEKIGQLEDRILKLIQFVKKLKDEKTKLEKRVDILEEDLTKKMDELSSLQKQMTPLKQIEDDFNKLKEERVLVRSKVENILSELESVDLTGE